MRVYAIMRKGRFEFYSLAKTKEEFNEKVEESFWNWRGCQSRDAPEESKSKEAWMKTVRFVSVEVNDLEATP